MEIRPILSAMRRNKFGALLIATQMAVTLAFLANALTLVEQRHRLERPAYGLDEADIFVMQTEMVDHPQRSGCASGSGHGGAARAARRRRCVHHEYVPLGRRRVDRDRQFDRRPKDPDGVHRPIHRG